MEHNKKNPLMNDLEWQRDGKGSSFEKLVKTDDAAAKTGSAQMS